MYKDVYINIYIYICISLNKGIYMYVYIYVYIYIYAEPLEPSGMWKSHVLLWGKTRWHGGPSQSTPTETDRHPISLWHQIPISNEDHQLLLYVPVNVQYGIVRFLQISHGDYECAQHA